VNTQTTSTAPLRVGSVRGVGEPASTLRFPQLHKVSSGYSSYVVVQNTTGQGTPRDDSLL
jgi:hypothetical protein